MIFEVFLSIRRTRERERERERQIHFDEVDGITGKKKQSIIPPALSPHHLMPANLSICTFAKTFVHECFSLSLSLSLFFRFICCLRRELIRSSIKLIHKLSASEVSIPPSGGKEGKAERGEDTDTGRQANIDLFGDVFLVCIKRESSGRETSSELVCRFPVLCHARSQNDLRFAKDMNNCSGSSFPPPALLLSHSIDAILSRPDPPATHQHPSAASKGKKTTKNKHSFSWSHFRIQSTSGYFCFRCGKVREAAFFVLFDTHASCYRRSKDRPPCQPIL